LFHPRAGSDGFDFEFFYEPDEIEVEAAPARFAVVLSTQDFLHGRINPDLPAIVIVLGFAIFESYLQRQSVPLPARTHCLHQLP
jgi:hypothetical protein